MRKLLALLILSLTATMASAQYRHHHHHYSGGWGFGQVVVPLVIGGVVGAAIARNNEPAPVVVQQPAGPVTYSCPAPYQPYFTRTYATDQYGRIIPVDQFSGCR